MGRTRLTLAIDFDDTIAEQDWDIFPTPGPLKAGVKEALDQLIKQYDIIIYSCRSNHRMADRVQAIAAMELYLLKHQIPFTRIDMGFEGKVIADAYIDDKAIAFENNWDEISAALLS